MNNYGKLLITKNIIFIISFEKDINNLTSKYWYSKFEHGEGGCEHVSFFSDIKDELEKYYYQNYDLRKISDNILRALCYIYNKKKNNPGNFDEELCSYLYYWLGDKIYHKVNKTVFSKIINVIFQELYKNNAEDIIICKANNHSIDQERFNDNKVLFDYSKDYQYIEMVTAHGGTTCDSIYKNYIKKYIDIYIDAYSNCTGNNDKKYECHKYSEILNKKLYPKLSTFPCVHSENARAVLERQKRPEQQETALDHHFTFPSVMDSASDRRTPVGPILNKQQNLPSLKNSGPIEALSVDDTTGGSTSKTIAGSIVPVLGVSSFSLLLYKVILYVIIIQKTIVFI
ncbi:hypothetical protein PVBG_04018 [Plasmodium vivax Brazil I]|uniref:Variable surface protein Vir7-like protein n=1 Tax=Plasmodium vivax (strain Brazil I) TaxID=1033975 RepID=A0A0J9VK27_PLAV1|nr:hypothetical protein PVBG_04018 [Plasmodium vivax Brazil I]